MIGNWLLCKPLAIEAACEGSNHSLQSCEPRLQIGVVVFNKHPVTCRVQLGGSIGRLKRQLRLGNKCNGSHPAG